MVVAQETKWRVDLTCLILPTEALEWCKPMPCLCCVLSSVPWGEKHEPPPICFRSRVSSQALLMDSQSSFLSALFSPFLAFCADLSSLLLVPDGFWLLSVSYVCQSYHWNPGSILSFFFHFTRASSDCFTNLSHETETEKNKTWAFCLQRWKQRRD